MVWDSQRVLLKGLLNKHRNILYKNIINLWCDPFSLNFKLFFLNHTHYTIKCVADFLLHIVISHISTPKSSKQSSWKAPCPEISLPKEPQEPPGRISLTQVLISRQQGPLLPRQPALLVGLKNPPKRIELLTLSSMYMTCFIIHDLICFYLGRKNPSKQQENNDHQ